VCDHRISATTGNNRGDRHHHLEQLHDELHDQYHKQYHQ
jgi:hypothetical protein